MARLHDQSDTLLKHGAPESELIYPSAVLSPESIHLPNLIKYVRTARAMLIGIFLMMLVYALYFARDFFMPVTLAILLALMLTPIVRFTKKRLGISEAISATLLVIFSFSFIGVTGYLLSGPVTEMLSEAPEIGRELTAKLHRLQAPVEHLLSISKQVDQVAQMGQDPKVQTVSLAQPGILSQAAGNVLSGGTTIAVTFILTLFILASGTMFYEKIIQSFGKLSEKKRALRVVYDVEQVISSYLLTITIINGLLGLAVGLGLWALDMPTPFVFGVMAALLNFLPYIGAMTTIVVVGIIAIVSFDQVVYALLAPLFVLACNIVEGQIVTPTIIGRRLELNTVAVFVAVAFWSWLWGFIGALIAVPLLVVIKVFCDHFEPLRHVGNFLSAQVADDEAEPIPEPKPEKAGTN